MEELNKNAGERVEKEHTVYGPDKEASLNKEIFIAEYNSLRGEILQRIAQQTTLYQIAITAFGVIIGYSLEKIDSSNWYNDVILVCVYPLLALLLSYAWAFNQIRICQIAQYLRFREKQITKIIGLIWWENYIIQEPSITHDEIKSYPSQVKNRPGFMILSGTQIASIALAAILLLIHYTDSKSRTTQVALEKGLIEKIGDAQIYLLLLLLVINIVITFITYNIIKKSGGS